MYETVDFETNDEVRANATAKVGKCNSQIIRVFF